METLARAFLAITLAIALPTPEVQAQDVKELEARIAQLEVLLADMIERQKIKEEADPAPVPTDFESIESHIYKFGGYMKIDGAYSQYSGGDLAPSSAGTQFYIPGTIPVGGESESSNLNTQARESRIYFRSDHVLDSGDTMTTYFELDFFLSDLGDERVSNSYQPRMRHAYVTWNNWLVGQTWSTFQDVAALPENLDFIGPAEGTVFQRQPMLRYTMDAWEFALENPETTLTPFGGGTRIVADDDPLPDVVARYTHTMNNGYLKVAGLLRQLDYEIGDGSDSATGFGISVSGKHFIGRDDIRWMATYGDGIGRYFGVNTANDGVLDSNGNIDTVRQFGAFVSYRHLWNPKWRSNLTLGYLDNDHDTALSGFDVTKDVYSLHANLLYQPVEKMTIGGEVIYAERELESGLDGDLTRFLFSMKYAF